MVRIVSDNIISALGFDTAENLQAIQVGRSGIVPHTDDRISDTCGFMAATIDDIRLQKFVQQQRLHCYTRIEQCMILSIANALSGTNITLSDADTVLVVSTTKGNIDLLDGSDNIPSAAFIAEMAAHVAEYFKAVRTPTIISNACISGLAAIVAAQRMIADGLCRQAVVCGADMLSRFICSGFQTFKSLSKTRCRPYDAAHCGLNLGEAAATIVLSQTDSDGIIVAGGALSNDANHISGPSRTGMELGMAMQQALCEAGLVTADIAFVNMHGTATLYNDEMESKALHSVGLGNCPLNSLKPYLGHTLGASGVVETIVCAHELQQQILYGTLGFEHIGTPLPLNLDSRNRTISGDTCIKTASGFGGCNAAVVLTLRNNLKRNIIQNIHLTERRRCTIADGRICIDGNEVLCCNDNFETLIRKAQHLLEAPNLKFGKMDNLSKMAYVAVGWLLRDINDVDVERMALFFSNAAASLDTDLRHRRSIVAGDAVAHPSIFVYTLPNVAMGEVCIRYHIKSENIFYISSHYDRAALRIAAESAMRHNPYIRQVIIGRCEVLGNDYFCDLELLQNYDA